MAFKAAGTTCSDQWDTSKGMINNHFEATGSNKPGLANSPEGTELMGHDEDQKKLPSKHRENQNV